MAMGRQKAKQSGLWAGTDEIPRRASRSILAKVSGVLAESKFVGKVEQLCQRFHKPGEGA